VYLILLIAGCYFGDVFMRSHQLRWVKKEDTYYADMPGDTPIAPRPPLQNSEPLFCLFTSLFSYYFKLGTDIP
jgi:hypothetical protein